MAFLVSCAAADESATDSDEDALTSLGARRTALDNYRLGAAACDDELDYVSARGIRLNGTCADDVELFGDGALTTGTYQPRASERCGTIAVAFRDRTHADAYWVDDTPSDPECPVLPRHPART